MKKENVYLGADLGGTKLLVGEMTQSGKLLRYKRYPSGPLTQQQAAELIETGIADFLDTVHPKEEPLPCAIGIGLVGRIDSDRGVWMEIDPARCTEVPIARQIEARFGLPCFVDNDVRSATKAELHFGRGGESNNLIYINVGTGIAAGVVVNGQLLHGSHYNAGEVGHTSSGVALHMPCVCGRADCVETVASGSGLDACARRLREKYPETALPIPAEGRVSAKEVFRRYGEDALCTELVENAAQGVANLMMNMIRETDPDMIVLGGGMLSDGFLYPKIMEKLDPYTARFVTNGIVLTTLDPAYIGVLGAASNALEGMERRRILC